MFIHKHFEQNNTLKLNLFILLLLLFLIKCFKVVILFFILEHIKAAFCVLFRYIKSAYAKVWMQLCIPRSPLQDAIVWQAGSAAARICLFAVHQRWTARIKTLVKLVRRGIPDGRVNDAGKELLPAVSLSPGVAL